MVGQPSNYPPGVNGTEPQITGEPDDSIDPMQIAQDELAADMVPTPDDVLDSVGPFAALYYATQTVAFAVGRFSATLDTGGDDDPGDDSEPVRALAAMTDALGRLTGACSIIGIYPPDAAADIPPAVGD